MRIEKLRLSAGRSSAVAGAMIAAAAALGLGACGGDDALNEQTLRFKDREGQIRESVDAAPRTLAQEQLTPGDQIVVTRQLLDESGDRAATVHEVCAVTAGRNRNGTEICQAVVELADGKLSLSKTNGLAESFQPAPITGGTGAYEGATGTMTVVEDGAGERRSQRDIGIEIHLFLP